VDKAHGKEYEIRFDVEFGTGQFFHTQAAVPGNRLP
jgi:hypothetical protein